jgi:hypothetical protein
MNIYIRPNGDVQCIYDEKIDLAQIGAVDIRRASHVEPDPDCPGAWYIDLAPVGGPRISGFATRAEALKAEVEWLEYQLRHRAVRVQGPQRE